MREFLKDYVANKEFLRDIYVKGVQRLSQREQIERLSEMTFARVQVGEKLPEKFCVGAGEATPAPSDSEGGHGEARGGAGHWRSPVGRRTGRRRKTRRCLHDVRDSGAARLSPPCRADHASIDAGPAQRLNTQILAEAKIADAHRCLAAPVLGSAVGTDRLDRLLAPLVQDQPQQSDLELAKLMLKEFEVAGLKMNRDEKAELPEDDTEALAKVLSEFRAQRLPRWRSLNVLSA